MNTVESVNSDEPVTTVAGSSLRIEIPKGKYLKKFESNQHSINLELGESKKIALLFICLNDRYWPYVAQVIKDCRKHFLTNHKVDYFVWTDYNEQTKQKQLKDLDQLLEAFVEAPQEKKQETLSNFFSVFANIVKLYEQFYTPQLQAAFQQMGQNGLFFKRDGMKFWFESVRPTVTLQDMQMVYEVAKNVLLLSQNDMDAALQGVTVIDTDAVPWPSPTLMRYHLFLNEEEKLKDYDHIFYMDADMRVVDSIGDEILSEGLTAAEHPMHHLRKEYIPPYEPNKESTAYIPRPGKVIDENGKPRFRPYYFAGGFQGGLAKDFIKAMQVMKANIDKDFDKNYIAVWNDESHWNKYLFDCQEPDVILSPSYVYPDSLIKEYYEPLWGQSFEPKIITLTKPFTLSVQAAQEINKVINRK